MDQQQISSPTLLGRHNALGENRKSLLCPIDGRKSNPVVGTRSRSPSTHEQIERNRLSLYQDGMQHQLQQHCFQLPRALQHSQTFDQSCQLRERGPFHTPQHLAKDPLALAIERLIDHGMDPSLAYATVVGQPVTRPGAVGHSTVAQLQPAMSLLTPFGGRNNQTLALSELLPR